jgi:hypothetical protein
MNNQKIKVVAVGPLATTEILKGIVSTLGYNLWQFQSFSCLKGAIQDNSRIGILVCWPDPQGLLDDNEYYFTELVRNFSDQLDKQDLPPRAILIIPQRIDTIKNGPYSQLRDRILATGGYILYNEINRPISGELIKTALTQSLKPSK